MHDHKRRVVITGLGTVSPVGNDVRTAWANVRDARSGIGALTRIDGSLLPTRIAGEVRQFAAEDWMPAKDARRTDPFVHYGVAAGMQAFVESGLVVDEANAARVGVIFGSGIGGLGTMEEVAVKIDADGPRKVSPFYIPSIMINMIAGHLSITLGLKGPNFGTVSACTTSSHAIGVAMRLIQAGDADAVLAGGAECATTGTAMAGFSAARAMTTRNEAPERASRPWDRDRDGFALSDGAGALMLEEYEHARRRGAHIHAELIGFGMGNDAYHVTSPPPDGAGAARSMKAALSDAGIQPEDIDYLNAHATSTPVGDLAEVAAIHRVFGDYAQRLPVSSTKSTTGHLLGAAGAVEAIYSVMAVQHGVIPPTANLDTPGEGCDLDFVPLVARDAKLRTVMSNSFGFGGTNGTLIIRAL